ncbi:MAG TPA: PAS domain-containing sensor histidine kinase [Dongiaceae bacterium]|jgi:two-component system nitrogen regulation sensor histidine kinase NtrY|nr:PAS domain-containing sensor histidine kinase [Dongiaceae bacterium]
MRSELVWLRRVNWERNIVAVLMLLAFMSGSLTYMVMRRYWQVQDQDKAITYLLLSDVCLACGLAIVVIRRVIQVWIERKRGLAGAKLHSRLALQFALISLIPTMIVTTVSTAFFDYGLNSWFSDRIRATIGSSLNVAHAYITENEKRITNDSNSIASDLRNSGIGDILTSGAAEEFLTAEISARDLTSAALVDSGRQILAHGGFSITTDPDIPADAFLRARQGRTVIINAADGREVRALTALGPELYLYISRVLDEQVLSNVHDNEDLVKLYRRLDSQRSQVKITVAGIFAVLAVLLLIIAVWFAIGQASRLVKPISRLDRATRKLGQGDFGARVRTDGAIDELAHLSRAFNNMAQQLQQQRQDLVDANRQIDERRQFSELVLAGVSAGVIGMDEMGCVDLPNRSASELLGRDLSACRGQDIAAVVPEFATIVDEAKARPGRIMEDQISVKTGAGPRIFHVRALADLEGGHKPVLTFDDLSELLAAQRKAAWADIARRIAHEIKNPLTPISLSAERLKRKYLGQIAEDRETFAICTDTIIRHVGDIGRLVDEFSAFARMPAPVLQRENPVELARQVLLLQQNANGNFTYRFVPPEGEIFIECDAGQFNRVLTNLLKNAAEAIEGRQELGDTRAGDITLEMRRGDGMLEITIDDNGVGLPSDGRERLTEPYVTTRAKGTGLGLAIVKKIMEDHGGKLTLTDRPGGGARLILTFPLAGE